MRLGLGAAAAALLVLAAAVWWGLREDADPFAVRIVAPELDLSRAGEAAGRWIENGSTRPVRLRVAEAAAPLAIAVDDASDAAPLGRIVLGDGADVLQYHAASRSPGLGSELLPNRLALVQTDAGAPGRPALLLSPGIPPAGPAGLWLRHLDGESGPRLLATAAVLGAWAVLREGRLLPGADGRPRLPFFQPADPDWALLPGGSLAGYLSEADARYLVAEPGAREAAYAELSARLDLVPEIAQRLDALATAAAPAVSRDSIDEAVARLEGHANALRAYLDSSWIESIARLVAPDRLRIELYVHTLVPVELRAFVADLPPRLLLLEKNAIGRLRLRALPKGSDVAVRARRQRLVFPLEQRVDPIPLGPYRFRSTRLDFLVEGLEASPRLREQLLDALRPQVVETLRGRELAPEHVRSLSTIEDPRYGQDGQETVEAFRAALPQRLRGDSARRATRWDPARRTLTIAAGSYEVLDDLIPPPGVGLRLEAGVELRVHPGRSILIRGPLAVAGSARRPVRIRGAFPERPWGVLALQGADGLGHEPPRSRIDHLVLEGGSADSLRGADYNGQLSVHHQDLVLAHTTLRGSQGEDSLNARYASVAIRDCAFLESAGDAVDLDWAEATIERSLFVETGPEGDGLDVSGSRVTVRDSVFAAARDKCLSVGERSELTLRGSLLRGCTLGLASKDLSETLIEESVFLDNERDLAAYQKKAVFGGGRIRAVGLLLVGARSGSERDAVSEIELDDSVWLGGEPGDVEARRSSEHPLDSPQTGRLGLDALAAAPAFSAADYRRLRAALR